MNPFRFLPIGFLLCGASSVAQSTPQGPGHSTYNVKNVIDWPTEFGAAGDFKRIVGGSFTGQLWPGAAALVGDKLVVLFDPAIHASLQIVAEGVVDFDLLPPADPLGRAALVYAEANAIRYAELGDAVFPDYEPVVNTSAIDSGPQATLALIRAADLDGLGREDIVGASGTLIRMWRHDSGLAWIADTPFSALDTVLDIVPVDWDDDGFDELALVTVSGVEVRETDGGLLDQFVGAGHGGLLAAMPTPDAGDRLVWSTLAGGRDTLLVLAPGHSRTFCGFSPQPPSALVTSRVGAGLLELAVPNRLDEFVRLYSEEAPPANPFDAANPNAELSSAPQVTGDGRPEFSDLTGDGRNNMLIGRGGPDEFHFIGPEQTLAMVVGEQAWSCPSFFYWSDGVDEKVWFQVYIELPNDLEPYNRLQVITWRSANGTILEHVAVSNDLYPITADVNCTGVAGHMRVWILLEGETNCLLSNAAYVPEIRFVDWDGVEIVAASASIQGGVATDENVINAMLPKPGAQKVFVDFENSGCPDWPSPSPSFIPLARPMPMAPGTQAVPLKPSDNPPEDPLE